MRSRFTAFAVGDAAHLRASWHPATVPDALYLDDDVRWERLEIVAADGGGDADRGGTVEFRAHWRDVRTGERGVLSERSRFRKAGDSWLYFDGTIAHTSGS